MAEVVLEQVEKVYPNGAHAIRGLDLHVHDGEFLVLVGPSGCGKSTALRMIAGLEEISEGTVVIGDQIVNDVEPKDRDIAMVFQNYALYPHMSVLKNIGFALRLAKRPRPEVRQRVDDAAAVLELSELLERRPGQLSGGQRQRVAMGRAIVRQPAVFLMDEPLSNLDAKLRVQMRAEIARLQRDLGVTTIYVTHDQVEAMTMGDRVCVLKDGLLQQVDSPKRLYDEPANVFTAAFIGSPSMNLYDATLAPGPAGGTMLELGSISLTVLADALATRPAVRDRVGQPITVGIRPEQMEDAALVPDHPAGQRFRATAALVESLGAEVLAHFRIDAQPAATGDPDAVDEVALGAGAPCVARFNPRTEVRVGDDVEIAVDTTRLHFFDPLSGDRLG